MASLGILHAKRKSELFEEQRQGLEQFKKEHRKSIEESDDWIKLTETTAQCNGLAQRGSYLLTQS